GGGPGSYRGGNQVSAVHAHELCALVPEESADDVVHLLDEPARVDHHDTGRVRRPSACHDALIARRPAPRFTSRSVEWHEASSEVTAFLRASRRRLRLGVDAHRGEAMAK